MNRPEFMEQMPKMPSVTTEAKKSVTTDNQYEHPCVECGEILTEDVNIECLENDEGEEKVVCSSCWCECKHDLKEQGWRRNDEDEEESDDEDEEESDDEE